MVGFAAVAGAGYFRFPVRGFFVEPAEGFSALGDRRPGFIGIGDIGHEAASGEGDLTALRRLALRHPEAARLLCGGGRLGEGLRPNLCGQAPETDEQKQYEGPACHGAHPSTEAFGCVNHVSTAGC